MEDEQKSAEKEDVQKPQESTAVTQPKPSARPTAHFSENVKIVRRTCGYITITATTIFAFIAILSIWFEMGDDIVWRSFASLAIVGFGALIVAAVAPLVDKQN